jgi:hypothetical protein
VLQGVQECETFDEFIIFSSLENEPIHDRSCFMKCNPSAKLIVVVNLLADYN